MWSEFSILHDFYVNRHLITLVVHKIMYFEYLLWSPHRFDDNRYPQYRILWITIKKWSFHTYPWFPSFLLYVRCKSGVAFIRRCFHVASGKHVRVKYTPQTPLVYSKNGVCRGIPIFLFLLQNIDCGYSLEPPRRGGSNVYPQSMLWAKINVPMKIIDFWPEKLLYIVIRACFRNG